jgi:putative polyhydroxyalkanoate system protein
MAVSVSRPHPFDHATARKRVDVLAQTLSRKLNLRTSWDGDRLSFKRTGAQGHIEVTPDHVHVEIRTSRFLPISDDRLRKQVDAVLDEHIPPMPEGRHRDADDASDANEVEDDDEDPDPAASTATEEPKTATSPDEVTGSLGALASGLLGAALQTGSASVNAVQHLLLDATSKETLSDAQLEHIGRQLQQARTEAGLSLDDVSRRFGIDVSLLRAIEQGTGHLTAPLLRRLTRVLPRLANPGSTSASSDESASENS